MNPSLNRAVHKIAFIYNPVSGKGKSYQLYDKFKSELSGEFEVVPFQTSPKNTIADVASICKNGFNPILVAGGDGTIHDVINGILISGKNPFLGIIPVGTGNDLAREFGLFEKFCKDEKSYLKLLCDNILNPNHITHPVLSLNNELFFSNYLGIGFDGAIINEFHRKRFLKLPNKLIYFFCVINTLLKGACYKISLPYLADKNSKFLHKTVKQLLILNIGSYGGGVIKTEKEEDDSSFRVLVFEEIRELLNFFLQKKIPNFFLRLIWCNKKPLSVLTSKVVVELLNAAPVQIDGEERSSVYGKRGILTIQQAGSIRIINF